MYLGKPLPNDERSNGNKAAVTRCEFLALPNISKQDIVSERYQLWRKVANHLLCSSLRLRFRHVLSPSSEVLGECPSARSPQGHVRVGEDGAAPRGTARPTAQRRATSGHPGCWPYSSSVTRSPHSLSGPVAGASQIARCVMKWYLAAPCQCHSPGGV